MPEAIATALLFALLALNVYRAWTLSIVMDEAYTYLSFVAPPWKQLLTTYSPNHHVLHSLLCKVSVGLFGLSEFTLRLPSVGGGLIYFAAVLALSRSLFGRGWLMLLCVALSTMNPMIMDYMSQARGYSLALGLYFAAVLAALRPDRQWLAAAGAALGLCVSANLTFAIPVIALNIPILISCKTNPKRGAWLLLPELAVAGAILGGPLLHAGTGELVGGFTSAMEALNNFAIACVVHDWEGNPPVRLWMLLYPLLRFAVAATAVVALAFRARLIAGILPLSLGILFLVHTFSGLPWPFARMVIYLWPMLAFTMCLAIRTYRLVAMPYLAFSLLLIVQFALQLNTDHYGWLGYSAGTRQIALSISDGRNIQMDVSGPLFPCLSFYKVMYTKQNWTLTPYTPGHAYGAYLVLDVFDSANGIPPGYRRTYAEPLSKATVQQRDQ